MDEIKVFKINDDDNNDGLHHCHRTSRYVFSIKKCDGNVLTLHSFFIIIIN